MSRVCYHADASFQDKQTDQFHLIQIVENEPGYYVVRGYTDLADAQDAAKALNDLAKLSREDVYEIRISSMFTSRIR